MTAKPFIANAYDISPFAPMVMNCDDGPANIGFFPTMTGTEIYQQLERYGTMLSCADLEPDEGVMQVNVWSAEQPDASSLFRPDQTAILCYNTLSGAVMLSCARTRESPLLIVAPNHFVALFYDEEWRFAGSKTNSDQRLLLAYGMVAPARQTQIAEDFINRLGRKPD